MRRKIRPINADHRCGTIIIIVLLLHHRRCGGGFVGTGTIAPISFLKQQHTKQHNADGS